MTALFSAYPRLSELLPHITIADLPTPVEKLPGLCRRFDRDDLYIKRDDMSGELYGGNKIRKLEFLLADAKQQKAKRLITSGAAGSNHALATALYGTRLGFKVTLMLTEQPWNEKIAPTLLADAATGAEMYLNPTYHRHLAHLAILTKEYAETDGNAPYVIPPGGSSVLGTIGYVNAAFELREQIRSGALPEPSVIFAALGTMGTAVGLHLGLQAAGIRSAICAVRVVPDVVADLQKCMTLFRECNNLIRSIDPSFPRCAFNRSLFELSDAFFGEGYGISTPEGLAAIDTFSTHDHITLDPVYTGKTAAAFLGAASQHSESGPLLFINSKSATFPTPTDNDADFRILPEPFHHYFTQQHPDPLQ